MDNLVALSPIDGRYYDKTKSIREYFSEASIIKYRVNVEIEYFIALYEQGIPQLKEIDAKTIEKLATIVTNFTLEDAKRVKEIESVTNHDVKAIEYFIKEKFNDLGLGKYKEFIHFGLTSQDINNTAFPLATKECYIEVIKPALQEVLDKLLELSREWEHIPMLAKTHGQAASPTRLGKEIFVFYERLNKQIALCDAIGFYGKFGGATGNFNAHCVAYPDINWIEFGDKFVSEKLGLTRYLNTTQIEHYDDAAAFFDGIKRINNILMDFDRDIWTYVSMNYFKQKIKKGEVGSSAMPHKVNPIDFENSEGNIGIANAILEHLSAKLPISRLQRDLSDSTVIRNIGVPLAHSLIAYKSILKGLNKLILNPDTIKNDLEKNWAVVAEAIQTILRRENYPNPYEALKELTRTNTTIKEENIKEFIETLEVNEEVKAELRKISPHNYFGINDLSV